MTALTQVLLIQRLQWSFPHHSPFGQVPKKPHFCMDGLSGLPGISKSILRARLDDVLMRIPRFSLLELRVSMAHLEANGQPRQLFGCIAMVSYIEQRCDSR